MVEVTPAEVRRARDSWACDLSLPVALVETLLVALVQDPCLLQLSNPVVASGCRVAAAALYQLPWLRLGAAEQRRPCPALAGLLG